MIKFLIGGNYHYNPFKNLTCNKQRKTWELNPDNTEYKELKTYNCPDCRKILIRVYSTPTLVLPGMHFALADIGFIFRILF